MEVTRDFIERFDSSIINSVMSEQEKTVLLMLSSQTASFIDFAESGGIDAIYMSLQQQLDVEHGVNTRTLGCTVNTRQVLGSAVT